MVTKGEGQKGNVVEYLQEGVPVAKADSRQSFEADGLLFARQCLQSRTKVDPVVAAVNHDH